MTPELPAIPAGGRRWRPVLANLPLLTLVGAGAAAAGAGGFVALAPNRLVSGRPIALWIAAGPGGTAMIVGLGVALASVALCRDSRRVHLAATLLAALLLLAVSAAAGTSAARMAAGAPGVARVSLGLGFWGLLGAAGLAMVDGVQRARLGIGAQLTIAAALVAAIVAMVAAGMFDALSIAQEYWTRAPAFADAVLRHVVLVAGSVAPAIVIGMPLGLLAVRRPRYAGLIFATLNLLYTVPSIALFGLLIAPLSALAAAFPALAAFGIGGIGLAPALIALTLYALLPVARNTAAGIAAIDPGAVEAARGMGMTRGQVLRRVELPLALPILLAGLRIVVVQAIGLAVIAALIGAGGLGTFVFAGLGQYAADLVLLGALPAIFLALAADFLLRAVSGRWR